MSRAAGTALVLVLTGLTVLAQTAPPPVGGRLAGAMLLGERPLSADDLPADLSSSDRMRLVAYIERKPTHALDRQIVAAIEAEGLDPAARLVASRLAAATGPDAEATEAEALLRDKANAAAAPFLYAYLAARYRLQLEQAPDDRPALERLAKKYRTMVDRVRNSGDNLFRILAEDLDNRQALTAGATRHPRQYLPDT
jgi:trans-2-enoyl-CoA reductase